MTPDPAALGRRAAAPYLAREVRPSPRELAQELGVEVMERPAPPLAQPGLRAEYQAAPPRITLYRASLDRLAAAIQASPRAELRACDLEEVHIAHEVFHHLEFGGRLGPLRPAESEQAAHAFAQALCDLPFDPRELSEMW